MATIKVLPSGAFQIRLVSKLLPKPFYATFDTREEAVAYSDQLTLLLSNGVVPQTLVDSRGEVRTTWTVARCIAEYLRVQSLPLSEIKLLDTIRPQLAQLTTSNLNYAWADAWISGMKRNEVLAPSTIRHRHGALARCFDWVCRTHPEILIQNPLRQLKRGFATYTTEDQAVLSGRGVETRVDVERNRRLEAGELDLILHALAGLPDEKALLLLALESAMRMRECYTLSADQINFAKRTIHLERTKNGDGRQVPMSSTAIEIMREYIQNERKAIAARDGRVFPFWKGDFAVKVLDATTSDLSLRYRAVFTSAGVADFRFHDLRHEATCRLYERTALSDVLIAKITGHRDVRMLRRYASLRGSDLAAHLW